MSLTKMSGQTEANSYSRKDSFNLNKLSQSLPETNAPLTMNDRKLSARGRNLLFGLAGVDTSGSSKSANTQNKSETLERKSSLRGFNKAPSLGSFGSMQDLLRHSNSFKNASIFDQMTPAGSYAGKQNSANSNNQNRTLLQPCFGSLASIEDHIMDTSRVDNSRQIARKPAIESDSDDDDHEVSAWDGTIAPGEQPPRKLSSLGLNKTLSDLFRTNDGDVPKDGGESDGSAVTTKAHLDHPSNGVPSSSSMSTSTALANAERGLGKKKLSLRGQKMFSEAHAHIPTKPPAANPASTLTHRQPMTMHNIQLEHHFQRQQQQQRLREQPQRAQYSQFGQQQFHPYQSTVQTSTPPYATYPNAFQAWSQPGMALGYPAPGSVPLVNNIMYNPAGASVFNPDAYGFVVGMGEKKLSFSSMPPAHKKTKKKSSGPRHKGSWTKAEDQLLKAAIEKHGMGSWQTISKLVHTRTAEQCRVRCRSISALNPDKKKGAFNETEDNLLKKITMLLIRNDAPGSPQKQHYMALSAGFTNSQPAAAGRKRKNAGNKSENGNDEFWFRVASEFNSEMQKLNLQKPYERTRKQLKERWQYNLDPSLNRGKWTEKENSIILTEKRKYRRGGWSAIAKLLPGRTPDMVKQRFNELLQEKMERDIM